VPKRPGPPGERSPPFPVVIRQIRAHIDSHLRMRPRQPACMPWRSPPGEGPPRGAPVGHERARARPTVTTRSNPARFRARRRHVSWRRATCLALIARSRRALPQ
jgi:hypothetical protein